MKFFQEIQSNKGMRISLVNTFGGNMKQLWYLSVGDLLQQRGSEIGVTTKRKRRCGWLDIALLKYTAMVNGYSALCLTKLDILDTLPEIKIGIAYRKDNKVLNYLPSSGAELAAVEVDYMTIPGWMTSIQNIREFEKLPYNAKKYVEKIEELVEVPVKWVGVGKGRESIITLY